MASYSRTKSRAQDLDTCLRSSPSAYSSSSGFASSSSSFTSRSSTFFTRAVSPTRVNMYGRSSYAPSVRFSMERPTSPGRSISVRKQPANAVPSSSSSRKKTCMCSPTTHPGSFRCALHKAAASSARGGYNSHHHRTASYQSNFRRSAMTNSLVRIGGVEGDLVKRALSALIRPSSHQQRRRTSFQPRPSRLSIMSKADDF